jgi:hypothetical protein
MSAEGRKMNVRLAAVGKEIETHYSNYMTVAHTGYEFILTFGLIIPPPLEELEGDTIEAEPIVRVVIPNHIFPSVVRAVQDNLRKFQESEVK